MLPAGGVLLFSWCVFFTCTLCQNVLSVVRLLQSNGPGLQALCGSNVESHFLNMLHQYRRALQRTETLELRAWALHWRLVSIIVAAQQNEDGVAIQA